MASNAERLLLRNIWVYDSILVSSSQLAFDEGFAMNRNKQWLQWAVELQSLAQAGLTYDSLGTIIDYYADIARGWYDEASSDQQSERATAAGASVRNSQRATVTVLYKFMQEVS